ncbi:hypothetical protein BD324DRAFT_619422 [Kockovaella imperatae]|uniref:Uncharacterized protein n=1 Tax=Kockovaella imperatae TaxID=4999 RepID=A0A1Y1UMU4_9TREE|nr:hypothetical protein BD324DRAFT_619422 [Kockovaella imperatae]ORX39371.1 hypothetical protein BD324DRAFT_619422 [Kockovaella imperatae]
MSATSSPVPTLMLQPPTPRAESSRRAVFENLPCIPFFESLDILDPMGSKPFDDEPTSPALDLNLLTPPGTPVRKHHRRRLHRKRYGHEHGASPSTPFTGIAIIGFIALLLLTSIASLSSPLAHLRHNNTASSRQTLFGRFRGRMNLVNALQSQSGVLDMTLSDMWTQVAIRKREIQLEAAAEPRGSGHVKAMSDNDWQQYRINARLPLPTAAMEFWDL